MASSKHQLVRLRTIHEALTRPKGARVSVTRLIELCDSKERTIKADLQYLRDQGAEIEWDRLLRGYYYKEPFDLPSGLTLSKSELAQLKIAVNTLNQFSHLDVFKDLVGMVDKIEKSVNFRLDHPTASRQIYFEPIPHISGTEYIPIFLNAIERSQAIEFDYQSFKSSEPIHHIINPYYLQEYSNRWYVVGEIRAIKQITAFAFDRMLNIPSLVAKGWFIRPDNATPEYLFSNVYGMSNIGEEPIEDVHLKFSPLQTKYFKSKPFHPFYEIKYDDESLIAGFKLIINFELIRKIASMGSDVIVLRPQTLVNKIIEFHQKSLMIYSKQP